MAKGKFNEASAYGLPRYHVRIDGRLYSVHFVYEKAERAVGTAKRAFKKVNIEIVTLMPGDDGYDLLSAKIKTRPDKPAVKRNGLGR